MKPLTYKALDNVNSLKAGHIYSVTAEGRHLRFQDVNNGASVFTMYKHEIDRAVLRGMLSVYDTTQSEAMHADVVRKLCQTLTTQYIY